MFNLRNSVLGSALLAGSLFTAACATNTSDDAVTEISPETALATVTMANGALVQFYEVDAGLIDIVQHTPKDVAPVKTGQLRPVEVFAMIAPGEAIPTALAQAQARLDELRAGRQPRSSTGTAITPYDISYSDFAAKFCGSEGGDFPFNFCYPPSSSDHVGSAHDVDNFKITVCVNSGQAHLTLIMDSQTVLSTDVVAGSTYKCVTHGYYSNGPNWDVVTDKVHVASSSTSYDLATKWSQ